jgi:glycosyltransferase involved in cell wall biosynthesis
MGGGLALSTRIEAAVARSRAAMDITVGSPPIGPRVPPFAATNIDAPQRFPEIDCLRARLKAEQLAAAEKRAARLGVGADRVLIASGKVSEEAYLRALGNRLGVAFEPLDDVDRSVCPIDDERLIESAAAGLLPLTIGGALRLTVAPRGTAARRLTSLIEDNPDLARRFRFTSTERLNRFVMRHAGRALTARAADALKRTWPTLSAGPPRRWRRIMPATIAGFATLAVLVLANAAALYVFEIVLAALFLSWIGLRLIGACIDWAGCDDRAEEPNDDALPVYSVIAALYREAASVGALLRAIERLDYPPEKLDVILAVEADDEETRAAIAAHHSRMAITVIPVPPSQPRTKPKALNVALAFARGTFTVIYDAEDRPDAGQLREALAAFDAGGERLACVQARLCVDNTADGWLARMFTAEYAGQFDMFLPGLAALHLPLPLGGSSNHFRTANLRQIGGWDAYNVTEDADLGMRLARFGYRAGVIASTTHEEAPARFAPWLRQRTRWFKGWMQTWLVHMREPRRLYGELGPAGFLSFQLLVGGNVLASDTPLWGGGAAAMLSAALFSVSVAAGYLASILLGWLGLRRRGLLASAWVLALTPLHWLMLSLAAWRGVYQLAVAPYLWEKTEHGLAKSSRRAADLMPSLLQLERYLSRLAQTGDLSAIGNGATDTSAAPPPRPRAYA